MAADLLEQQSAVLSVPWEYLRFFSMIGSSLIFPPFSSPLGRFSISFLHAAPIFLTTLWIMTHGFHVKAKMLVPFERETNPTFYHPDKCQDSRVPPFNSIGCFTMQHASYQSLSSSIFLLLPPTQASSCKTWHQKVVTECNIQEKSQRTWKTCSSSCIGTAAVSLSYENTIHTSICTPPGLDALGTWHSPGLEFQGPIS